jgi:hypothetical protein
MVVHSRTPGPAPTPTPPSRWDRISEKEKPTIRNPGAQVTDHCQCCGLYRDAFDFPGDEGDPLTVLEIDSVVGRDRHDLGTLCVCFLCVAALRGHFVDPFIEKYHQPLQERMRRIQKAAEDPF